ncbi:NAD(P)/FAD-dependent oxidoreductase [Flavobacterium sp. LBUM151]
MTQTVRNLSLILIFALYFSNPVIAQTKGRFIKASIGFGSSTSDYEEENPEIIDGFGFYAQGEYIIESTETLSEKVVDLKSTYVIASERISELPKVFKNAIFWDTSTPYIYFRATADNRIIMGGGDEEFKDAKKRDKLIPKKEQYLLKKFQRKFPKVKFKIDYSWAGTFGETKDGLPYFGKPNPDTNEHYVLGFGGNGITFSVIAMNSILDSINNKKNRDLDYYRFGR